MYGMTTIHKNCSYAQIRSKTGHLMIAGMSGFGKGMFAEGYITKMSEKGWKVFDINSESRGEGMYYGIKNTDSNFTGRLNFFSKNILKSRSYKSEIIMFLGNNINKIPKLPKNIRVCVFNEKWFQNEDMYKILAFNENQVGLLDTIFEAVDDRQMTLSQIYEFLKKGADKTTDEGKVLKGNVHYQSVSTVKRRCRTLLRSGLFYNDKEDSKYFEFLDLFASANKIDTITTFSTYLISDKYIRYVCLNLLIKKFIEFIELRQYFNPLLFYIREINDFYFSKKPPPYLEDIQDNISKILRQGRALGGTKISLVIDTQYLNDVPDHVFNSFNKFVIFRLPFSDAKKLLYKATIPELFIRKVAALNVGLAMYVANGEFYYPIRTMPTLHKKSEADFDVFQYLSDKFGVVDYSGSKFFIKNNNLVLGLKNSSNGGEKREGIYA